MKIEVTKEYIGAVDNLLTTLTANAAHCYGVDFGILNEALLDTTKYKRLLRDKEIEHEQSDT